MNGIWEKLGYNGIHGGDTFRVRVPNGWILRHEDYAGGANGGCHSVMIFIEDMNHVWKIEKENNG